MKAGVALSAFGLLALASCASGRGDPVVHCMIQVDPPGAYDYDGGQTPPLVVPGEGGTQAGADAVNACLRASPTVGSRATVETETATGATVRSYTYGTPPSRPSERVVASAAAAPAPGALAATSGLCTPGAPVIYRGTTYCPGP
ncbi:hypothetical protein [Salipiger mucosus]|uniref:Lipoprotein n=1 Tax=Salipiger mucosus DSM 16094 TaxID=1123237 RepID=S9R0W2_9RHOB|nr:hypothetical protein [Salipiger mucosus]EPX85522.1 hypothetical protein Salmuc_04793 [Salipiger mucosus DSM 16094]